MKIDDLLMQMATALNNMGDSAGAAMGLTGFCECLSCGHVWMDTSVLYAGGSNASIYCCYCKQNGKGIAFLNQEGLKQLIERQKEVE